MLIAKLVLFLAGGVGGFCDDRLQILRKAFKEGFVDGSDASRVEMSRQGEVILYLLKTRGLDQKERVLLAVHSALLQSGEQFRKRHRCGGCTQMREGAHVDAVFHGPDLQIPEIVGSVDRVGAVGDMADAVFHVGEVDQADVAQIGCRSGPQFSGDGGASGRLVLKQKGQVQHLHIFIKVRQHGRGAISHLQSAHLTGLKHHALGAKGRVGI